MTHIRSIGKFEYTAPDSLPELLKILETDTHGSRMLAGGTDLILQMKQGLVRPSVVVDVKKIPELNQIEWSEEEGLHIGAAVPFGRLLAFTALPKELGVLFQACSLIGSVQIKNRGTIGGNICNAAPSADSVPALLCLEASVVLASGKGARTIPLNDFFLAPGKTALADDELLVEIGIPAPPVPAAGCYLRHTTREEMDIAVAGAASFLALAPQKEHVKIARIALGAVAPTPMRAHRAEAMLIGKTMTKEIIEEAAESAALEASPISDLRGSEEYRRELVQVLVRRTLMGACEELGLTV